MTTRTRSTRGILQVLLALLMISSSLMASAAPADFGDKYITSVKIQIDESSYLTPNPDVPDTIWYYSSFLVWYEFEFPNDVTVENGSTMQVDFPTGLKPKLSGPEKLYLYNDDKTEIMGEGQVFTRDNGTSYIVITLNEKLSTLGERKGFFYLGASLLTTEDGVIELPVTINKVETVFRVNRRPRPATPGNEEHLKLAEKQTTYMGAPVSNVYRWYIRIHAGAEVPAWSTVTVTDTIGPFQKILPHEKGAIAQSEGTFRIRHFDPNLDRGIDSPLPDPSEYTITPTRDEDGVLNGVKVVINGPITRGYIIDFYVQLTKPQADIEEGVIVNYYRAWENKVNGFDSGSAKGTYKFEAGGGAGGISNYQIAFQKVDEAGNPIYLNPATVTLEHKEGQALPDGLRVSPGATLSYETDERKKAIIVADQDGKAGIAGLVTGQTYIVRELKAPIGFETITESREITIEGDKAIDCIIANKRLYQNEVAEKVWNGTSQPIFLQLYQDGLKVGDPVKLDGTPDTPNADGSGELEAWKYTWTKLPNADLGAHVYEYTVGEVNEAGEAYVDPAYTQTIKGMTVTNSWKRVSVGDFVWLDSNKNGIQDDGEPGIRDVKLTITTHDDKPVTDVDGNPVTETITDENGKYLFENLPVTEGGYKVTVTNPIGYAPTLEGVGVDRAIDSSTDFVISDPLPNDKDHDPKLDFGFIPEPPAPTTIHIGFKKELTGAELNAGDFKIELYVGDAATPEMTATNWGDGTFGFDIDIEEAGVYVYHVKEFEGSTPGMAYDQRRFTLTYTVEADASNKLVAKLTKQEIDGVDTPGADHVFFNVYTPSVSVGDFVWLDTNNNGLQDDGEPGIKDVKLTITTHDDKPVTDIYGKPVIETITDENGKYLFKDLPVTEGGYKVTVTRPDGYAPTLAEVGDDRAIDSSTDFVTSDPLPNDKDHDPKLDFGFILATEPEISKKINETLDHLDIGNERDYNYNIVVTLPNTIELYNKFVITDTLDARLNLVSAAIKGAAAAQFDVTTAGQQVTAAVKAGGFAALKGLPSVELVITAQIKAGVTDEKITNKAGLSFTNESNTDKDKESNTVTVTPPLYKLGDYVWFDDNRDGLQDSTDRPVPGVKVTISGPNLPAGYETTTTTDANGKYLFENLPNGTYNIVFENWPEGYVPTVTGAGDDVEKDSNGPTTSGEIKDKDNFSLDLGIVLIPSEPEISKKINETLDHLDIGNERDYNYNIVVTLPNTIELYNKFVITDTLDARLNLVSAAIKGAAAAQFDVTTAGQLVTATAKAGGFAALKGIPSVELVITAQIKAGVTDKLIPNTAGLSFTNESGVTKDKESNPVTVTPPLYKLGDYVWFDDNRDGLQDSTDRPVPGVKVTISGPNLPAGYETTTTTDANGKYLFENLPNGTYNIVFENWPEDYVPTIVQTTDAFKDIDSNGPVTSGEIKDADNLTLDLGIVKIPMVSVGDFVWIDSNYNGIQDAGEPMVMGAELKLTYLDGLPVVDAEGNMVPNTFTDVTGHYLFDKLTPTTGDERYIVHIVKGPDGYVPTIANAPGSTTANDSSTGSATSTALPNDGDEDMTLDFGFVKLYKLGDYVWYDTNKDGKQDAGEKPVPDVTVTISGPNLPEGYPTTTKTDASGKYIFENLPNGEYKVVFSDLPKGFEPTKTKAAGTTPDNDSNGLTSTNVIQDKDNLTVDLGIVEKLYKLGDYVWYDSNKDGKQDAGEKPVPNVTVTISGPNLPEGYPTTTKTDASGKYIFENLPNGEYKVVFSDLPKDYEPTKTKATGTTPENDSNGLTSTNVIQDKDNLTVDLGIVPVTLPEPPTPPKPTYPTLEVPLMAKKVLRNGSLQAGSFTFQLKDGAGNVLATVSNLGNGTVIFPSRTFSLEVTNYKFTIHEVAGSDDRIVYDDTVYTVLISTKAVEGELQATVNILRNGTPYAGDMIFTNQRKAPPTGDTTWRTISLLLGAAGLLGTGALILRRRRETAA